MSLCSVAITDEKINRRFDSYVKRCFNVNPFIKNKRFQLDSILGYKQNPKKEEGNL